MICKGLLIRLRTCRYNYDRGKRCRGCVLQGGAVMVLLDDDLLDEDG